MKLRKLDGNGDMQFGKSNGDFYYDDKKAIAQTIWTRLMLWYDEWFMDSDGTNWQGAVLGKQNVDTASQEIYQRILGTKGVKDITNFQVGFEPNKRVLTVDFAVDTDYGSLEKSFKINYTR